MPLKRTTVYADSEDLALIKEAAARNGVPEAEIIREGVHLAALASREWAEPFFDDSLQLGDRVTREQIRATVADRVGPGNAGRSAA